MHSQKVKEKESRESEVEKARMMLDDEDVLEESDLKVESDDDIEILADDEL